MTAQTHAPSADDFLFGGGGRSARFDTPGDTVTGTVEATEVRQQTDFTSQAPKFWDDGRPMMQLVVTLNTGAREDADDDGVRKVYVKGKSLTDAVRDAVRATGRRSLEVGGRLTVTYTGDGQAKQRGMNPPKLYSASYVAPDPAGDFLAGQVPSSQPPAEQTAAQSAQPPAAAGTEPQRPAAIPEVVWAGLTDEQKAQTAAAARAAAAQPPF